MRWLREARWPLLGGLLALLLLAVLAWLLVSLPPAGDPRPAPPGPGGAVRPPTPDPTKTLQPDLRAPLATLVPADATGVAATAGRAVGDVQLGTATSVVIAAGGTLLVAGPQPVEASEATVEHRTASGTAVAGRVHTDPLSGVTVVDLDRDRNDPLRLGSSQSLRIGQELIVASGGGAPPLKAIYLGRNQIELARFGLLQAVLDLRLPDGATVTQGMVLDGESRVVGVLAADKQAAAPPGRVFAIPVEQARDLFRRIGVDVEDPPPTPTRTPVRYRNDD